MSEIRCQFIILARKDEPTLDYAREEIPGLNRTGGKSGVSSWEIRCQFIILARKDEPTLDYAREEIPGLNRTAFDLAVYAS